MFLSECNNYAEEGNLEEFIQAHVEITLPSYKLALPLSQRRWASLWSTVRGVELCFEGLDDLVLVCQKGQGPLSLLLDLLVEVCRF